jgi:hypothetical protein
MLAFTFLCAGSLAACGWPETRMVPVADYASGSRATVSAAPAYTAGPSTVTTKSPDGATVFVCEDSTLRRGADVPPNAAPAC